jgi:cell division protein FtsX
MKIVKSFFYRNKNTLISICTNLAINGIVVIIMLVIINNNTSYSNKLIESSIQKQEDIHNKQEEKQSKEIEKKLNTISEVRKENKAISIRIDKVEKKIDAAYLINQKKINTKYDKESKAANNTITDSTASILSRLLKDTIQ